jgi:hypothetical protein
MKCMGFDELRGVDHLERLVKEITWAGLGPQIEYVYKTTNELFTELGYRQRPKNAAQKKREAKANEAPATAAEGAVNSAARTEAVAADKEAIVLKVAKDTGLYQAMVELFELYGIEPGPGCVNWQAQLAACNDYIEQQAKLAAAAAQAAPVPVAA